MTACKSAQYPLFDYVTVREKGEKKRSLHVIDVIRVGSVTAVASRGKGRAKQRTRSVRDLRTKNGARADEIFAESAPPLFARLTWEKQTWERQSSAEDMPCHHASFVDPSLPHLSLARAPTCPPCLGTGPARISFFMQSWRSIEYIQPRTAQYYYYVRQTPTPSPTAICCTVLPRVHCIVPFLFPFSLYDRKEGSSVRQLEKR